VRSPTGKHIILQKVQTGCGDHQPPVHLIQGALTQRVKRPGCKTKHSRLSRRLNPPTKQLVLYSWRQNTLDVFTVLTACVQNSLRLPHISTAVPNCAASVIKGLMSKAFWRRAIYHVHITHRSSLSNHNTLRQLITTNSTNLIDKY
jgi:hypothetical protein